MLQLAHRLALSIAFDAILPSRFQPLLLHQMSAATFVLSCGGYWPVSPLWDKESFLPYVGENPDASLLLPFICQKAQDVFPELPWDEAAQPLVTRIYVRIVFVYSCCLISTWFAEQGG